MSWRRSFLPAVAFAAVAAVASAQPATVSGAARYDGQEVVLRHGLAWWRASDNEVRVALFDHPPPPGMLADLRAGSWGEGGPAMTVHLRFDPAAPPALEGVTYCYLDATFPRGGSMGVNTEAKGCGLSALGGALRAGGRVQARLQGQAEGPREKPYAWDITLDLPITP